MTRYRKIHVIFLHFFFCSESANAAGFNVLRTISEPISALLSYDIGQTDNALEWYVLLLSLSFRRHIVYVDIKKQLSVCRYKEQIFVQLKILNKRNFAGYIYKYIYPLFQ